MTLDKYLIAGADLSSAHYLASLTDDMFVEHTARLETLPQV